MGKDILSKSRLHEDVFHFMSTHETIHVRICLQEDVIIATAV